MTPGTVLRVNMTDSGYASPGPGVTYDKPTWSMEPWTDDFIRTGYVRAGGIVVVLEYLPHPVGEGKIYGGPSVGYFTHPGAARVLYEGRVVLIDLYDVEVVEL